MEQLSRYSVEDFGSNGMELTIEIPGWTTARDLDLEIIEQEDVDGTNTHLLVVTLVRGNSAAHRDATVVSRRSFVLHETDNIDVDGVRARVSSGILRISMPTKMKREKGRTQQQQQRQLLRDSSSSSSSSGRVPIAVFSTKRDAGYEYGPDERSEKIPVVAAKKTDERRDAPDSRYDGKPTTEEDDLFISEEEDIIW